MSPQTPTQVIAALERTCGCTTAAREAAALIRALLEQRLMLIQELARVKELLSLSEDDYR